MSEEKLTDEELGEVTGGTESGAVDLLYKVFGISRSTAEQMVSSYLNGNTSEIDDILPRSSLSRLQFDTVLNDSKKDKL